MLSTDTLKLICTYLSLGDLIGRQEGGEAPLQRVGVAADGVPRVAVVRALAVEAEVVGRRHEECLQDVAFCDVIDLRGHVEYSSDYRHGAAEAQDPEGEV